MDIAGDIFSLICGRWRCFIIEGAALPLCQRCLGIYAGAAITAGWLMAVGMRRRGLPPMGIILVNAAALLAAMLGGLHVIDSGPAWRLACGLWTGHVVMLWLFCAATFFVRHFRLVTCSMPTASQGDDPPAGASEGFPGKDSKRASRSDAELPWSRANRAQAILMLPLLALAAMLFAEFLPPPRWLWVVMSLAGLAGMLATMLVAFSSAVVLIVRRHVQSDEKK